MSERGIMRRNLLRRPAALHCSSLEVLSSRLQAEFARGMLLGRRLPHISYRGALILCHAWLGLDSCYRDG